MVVVVVVVVEVVVVVVLDDFRGLAALDGFDDDEDGKRTFLKVGGWALCTCGGDGDDGREDGDGFG